MGKSGLPGKRVEAQRAGMIAAAVIWFLVKDDLGGFHDVSRDEVRDRSRGSWRP